jgi:basic amino acid/polyamine antiporter, APA family
MPDAAGSSAGLFPRRRTRIPNSVTTPPALLRGLRARDATAIIVGGIIGSGIFVSPGIVARHVPSVGVDLLVWAAAGLIAWCGALCYAELGAAMPETGGTYQFLRRTYRSPLVAFVFGWTFFLVDGPGSIAAVAVTFAAYFGGLVHLGSSSTWATRAIAAGLIVALTGINCFGVRRGALVQNVATVLKVAALLGIIVVAFGSAPGGATFSALLLPAGTRLVVGSLAAALVPALFAYDGWTYTSYVAGEMVDPRRDIPRSIVAGMTLVAAIYLLVNLAAAYVLPFPELQRSDHVASDVVARAVGPVGGRLVAVAIMISAIGALNAIVLIFPRIAFAMARDGLFFQSAARVHPRYQTPVVALWVQGTIAAAFAVSGTYEQILGYFAFVEFLLYALTIAGLIVLRIREPELARPYRVWGYPIPPLLFLLFGAWYLTNLVAVQWRTSLVGIAILLTGVPMYWHWQRARARGHPLP